LKAYKDDDRLHYKKYDFWQQLFVSDGEKMWIGKFRSFEYKEVERVEGVMCSS
jgi:hypothetical protein